MPQACLPAEAFFVARTTGRALQAQIREAVIEAVAGGRAPPGTRMPSSRSLAAHLGVARLTVTLAYQELVARGWLAATPRSGYRVAHAAPVARLAATGTEGPRVASGRGPGHGAARGPGGVADWDRLLGAVPEPRPRVVKPADWRRHPYPFVYGQMDASIFDHAAWRDCTRQALGRRDFEETAGDAFAADDPMLVDIIRRRSLPRRGIEARPGEILVTLGAQHALWLVAELLTRAPLVAATEEPGYPDTRHALGWCGAEVTPVLVGRAGLDPAALPEGIGAVFVTPSHHAPTGATMPLDRRHALLARARERDFVVVEDDYEFEMSFLGPPLPALKSLDADGRVIYVGSFSKALFPGLRLGYLVGPAPFIGAARELRAIMLRHPPGHLQRAAAYFLAQGHCDALIARMKERFAERRAALARALDGAGLEVAGAAGFGGSALWMKAPGGIDAGRLAARLLDRGVVIEPGAPWFAAGGPSPFFRLGYSVIAAQRIPEGVGRLRAAIDELRSCGEDAARLAEAPRRGRGRPRGGRRAPGAVEAPAGPR